MAHLRLWCDAADFHPTKPKTKKTWSRFAWYPRNRVVHLTVDSFAVLVKPGGQTDWIGYFFAPELRADL